VKLLIYADNHFSRNSSVLRKHGTKYSLRLENQINSINWVERTADIERCDAIVCLGDFFDKSTLSADEITALSSITWNMAIPHIFLVGNHEMGIQDLSISTAHLFSLFPDAFIVDASKFLCDGNTILYLVPYTLEENRKPLNDYMSEATYLSLPNHSYSMEKKAEDYANKVILSHNDIAGIQYGEFLSKYGFSVNEIEENCDLFVNGHLHNFTKVSDKIINLGNLTGQNFSEDAFKYCHYAMILDTDKVGTCVPPYELIENPYALNFYKLDFTQGNDVVETLNRIKNNAVLSVRVKDTDVASIKALIDDCDKVIECRYIHEVEIITDPKEFIYKTELDHLQKFTNYVLETMGNSEIVKEELIEVCR